MKIKTQIIRVLSAVFLFGYLLNVMSLETFHQAVHHHHHSELHSAEAEADACHRAIYHGGVSANCNHKTHVTGTETVCELCQVLISRGAHLISTIDSGLLAQATF